MRHWRVHWHHDHADEPVTLYCEIGDDDRETRRVEEFGDGGTGWADAHGGSRGTLLAEIAFGAIDDVSGEPGLSGSVIDAAEFEDAWRRARRGGGREQPPGA
ncbi:DUF6881 domain-containing protein [Streptomyces radicis]|uniref:DUF6881 domain-containing protein n=1 Tax=Streptomyces radicis TaxID=1750517 RepID=A0A3A9W761_9ACTN|nr:hypothetical protein [Streptomyces radicis]RKN09015.1 hypothetical protein D7319_13860 [Streptomyces radicis]RKN22794.1 hypothetical protein D7318_14695 [Streptomyces radicis]